MKLRSSLINWLDFVDEPVVVGVAPPTELVCVVRVGGVAVAAVPPRVMFPALQNSVKHGHTVALTLLMAPSSLE